MYANNKYKKIKKELLLRLSYLLSFIYVWFVMPYLVKRIRKKKVIKVAFLVQEVGVWKTERLYLEMLKHSAFCPLIIIPPCIEVEGSEKDVEKYCKKMGYQYITLGSDELIRDKYEADIIFYQKPYLNCYPRKCRIYYNLNSLFCYVYYTFHTFDDVWPYKPRLFFWCWQQYFENQETLEIVSNYMPNACKNGIVTGVPMMDSLMNPLQTYQNPWKHSDGRKRIIYAPHHSGIMSNDVLNYSTFLDYCDFIMQMAIKYSDYVVFAFKPHPSLKNKLINVWGKEKTEDYYNKWDNMENGQLEENDYINLMMHSDALIHDCSSFTIEYHYTHKPVLYIEKDTTHDQKLLPYVRKAYNLHYKAHCRNDIELFICNVINGCDPLETERELYFKEYLLPPNNQTACNNIINSILGIEND